MPVRFPTSKILLAGLLLVTAAAISCRGASGPKTGSLPEDGEATQSPSAEVLTAKQVLSIAGSAARSVISYRATGESLIKASRGDTQSAAINFEWSSSDRFEQAAHTTVTSETGIELADIYQLEDAIYAGKSRQELAQGTIHLAQMTMPIGGDSNFALLSLDLVEPVEMETVTLDGKQAYRLSGVPLTGLQSANRGDVQTEHEDVLFIDASDFRLIRVERTMSIDLGSPVAGPNLQRLVTPEAEPIDLTMVLKLDFEYSEEPIVVALPEGYVELGGERAGLPVRPADPEVATGTRRSVPIPAPVPTLPPPDPNQDTPVSLDETPDYEKLELGNGIVASYPKCNNRYSVADRFYNIMIIYRQDGSMAANGAVFSQTFDAARPDVFTHTRYHSSEGRAAIEAVLNDPEAMRRIREYEDISVRCPIELVQFTGHTFKNIPDTDRLVINRSTIARFEPCGSEGRTLSAPVLIAHLPSESMIALTPGADRAELVWSDDFDGLELLWTLVDDSSLQAQLAALAPREARCIQLPTLKSSL